VEIAALISFIALVLSWMAMPAEGSTKAEAAPTIQPAPVKA
jgi:hypothetical protein